MNYRRAVLADAQLLFDWVNEPGVRENSFDKNVITWSEHIKWFEGKLKEQNNSLILIFENNRKLIGQVRIDEQKDGLYIDYSVDVTERGKGYGGGMLAMIIQDIRTLFPKHKYLIAEVKKENVASLSVFKKLGFSLHSTYYKYSCEIFKFRKCLKEE